MKRRLTVTLILAGLVATSPALACSVAFPEDYAGSAKQREDVRQAINNASVIVDGEVIRAWTPGGSTLVRVEHVLKGYPPEYIEVLGGGAGDCSITLDRQGERLRLILVGGPKYYQLFRDQSEARIEDRILHSDRRKVWPYAPGIESGQKN